MRVHARDMGFFPYGCTEELYRKVHVPGNAAEGCELIVKRPSPPWSCKRDGSVMDGWKKDCDYCGRWREDCE